MAVAEIEQRARVEDRQIDGGALVDVGGVQVAAEVTGREAAERFLSVGRHRDAAEHRLERNFNALRRRVGGVEDPDHPVRSSRQVKARAGRGSLSMRV